jgi:hypothetical protein
MRQGHLRKIKLAAAALRKWALSYLAWRGRLNSLRQQATAAVDAVRPALPGPYTVGTYVARAWRCVRLVRDHKHFVRLAALGVP